MVRVTNVHMTAGYYRGIAIPLLTISAVRAASFTMYTETKNFVHKNGFLRRDRLRDIALAGWLGELQADAYCLCGVPVRRWAHFIQSSADVTTDTFSFQSFRVGQSQ